MNSEQHPCDADGTTNDETAATSGGCESEVQGERQGDRRIRSFVRRAGRLTVAQAKALEELLPRYGVPDQPLTLSAPACFGHDCPLVVEIGFGNGDALTHMAKVQPDHGFIGLEVHRPGVGHVLRLIADQALENVRVLEADAVEILKQRIAPASLAGVRIYFPDPWHKKRHNKRRLVQDEFLALVCERLAPGALLHLATDWEAYAEQMMAVCSRRDDLRNLAGPGQYSERPEWRPVTRFERRGLRLGHGVWDLIFRREATER